MIKICPNEINGIPVENLTIIPNPDGTYSITYSEKFNLITAHHKEIMKIAKDNKLECQVFKRLDYNFILIWLKQIDKAHLLLELFNVPNGCYEINKEDSMILIQLKKGEKYNKRFNSFS